ncbi:MAG TPA: ferric reductase-like transmembrane domain-containing protein [Gemmatimonadaceae bacterium]|nr:ferric reductase-like transmembrane domain-containing protein [Gemmatimonadaceae bacterium]
MTAIEISSYFGLAAMTLLTLNILLGLVMSVKYNPVREWPHRRINTFKIHNWTAYIALTIAAIHPLIILFSSTAKFSVIDIIYPVNAPKQPWINVLGALALYSLAFVVVTSYFRHDLGRKTWKSLHFTAYGTALLFYIHGIFTDPNLKDNPIDFFDGEKVYVELCMLLVLFAIAWRIRWQLKQPPARVHRPKPQRAERLRVIKARG